MEIRVGFTITPGPEGWQFSPIQFLKVYQTEGNENVDGLKNDLQAIMEYAEGRLAKYKKPDKDELMIAALKSIADSQKKLGKK